MEDMNSLPSQKNTTAQSGLSQELNLRLESFLRQKAPRTQSTYRGILREWLDFLARGKETRPSADLFLEATDLDAVAFRLYLERRPGQRARGESDISEVKEIQTKVETTQKRDGLQSTQSNRTIAKKFSALRRLYRMLMSYDFGIKRNPFDTERVDAPRANSGQKRPTMMIDYNLVKKILSLPELDDPKGLRDLALLSVLFGGGLRRGEVVALRLSDIKRSPSGTLYLQLRATKSGQDAEQGLPTWAAQTVEQLLQHRIENGAAKNSFLFVSFRGKGGAYPTEQALSESGLYNLFKSYCQRAGVTEGVSPHSARATAITRLLDEGLPHREVKEFSRHVSVQMVELYDKKRRSIDESPARHLDYGKSTRTHR